MSTSLSALWSLAFGLLISAPVLAQTPQHQHDDGHEHEHPTGAIAGLELDEGRKWPTDESLRAGMASIRKVFETHHPRIHAGTESDEQYVTLAQETENEVNFIIQNCKLPPAADANLHLVIADLLTGIRVMRGEFAGRSRHDGAALVHGALDAYGDHFDDPAW